MSNAIPKILVTRKMPDVVNKKLMSNFTVSLNESDKLFTEVELQRALKEADGILCSVTERFTKTTLNITDRKTKIIANFGVGLDHIDLKFAKSNSIVVTNTPDVLTDATADLAIYLILAATRKAYLSEKKLRDGKWTGFSAVEDLGVSLKGKTLGIIGMGRIGKATARRANMALGMKVIYFNRSYIGSIDFPARPAQSIGHVMRESDIVSIHLPGDKGNHGLINEEQISLMKDNSFFINTSRGEVVDQKALIEALSTRQIAGGGLDVFENEPNIPQSLIDLDNVTLLPHIGSATKEVRDQMGLLAVENLISYFGEKDCPSRVV